MTTIRTRPFPEELPEVAEWLRDNGVPPERVVRDAPPDLTAADGRITLLVYAHGADGLPILAGGALVMEPAVIRDPSRPPPAVWAWLTDGEEDR